MRHMKGVILAGTVRTRPDPVVRFDRDKASS
jgi:hypothetical protein